MLWPRAQYFTPRGSSDDGRERRAAGARADGIAGGGDGGGCCGRLSLSIFQKRMSLDKTE
jgi:hypothetical protein